jgi:hypothetical protein
VSTKSRAGKTTQVGIGWSPVLGGLLFVAFPVLIIGAIFAFGFLRAFVLFLLTFALLAIKMLLWPESTRNP